MKTGRNAFTAGPGAGSVGDAAYVALSSIEATFVPN
jgi:hypothetical protein